MRWSVPERWHAWLWVLLGRDGLTRAAADESRQLELCRYMWWVRHLTLAATLTVAATGHLAAGPTLLSAILFVAQATGHLWSVRVPSRAGLAAVLDAFAFVVLSALGLPGLVVLLVSVAILGWAATFRPIPALASLLAVLAAIGCSAAHPDGIRPDGTLLAFCLLGGIFMLRMIRLNVGARQAAARDELVGERVDAILWEEVPGTDTIKVSSGAERLLGYPASAWELPGFWREVVHPDDLPHWVETGTVRPAVATSAPQLRMRHADGSWRWLESRTRTVPDRLGRPAFHVGVLLDRTEQVDAEREALAFGHLVDLSPIGQLLISCTRDGGLAVEAVNPACRRALGLPDSVAGTRWPSPRAAGPVIAELVTGVRADGAARLEFTGPDGRIYQADAALVDRQLCKIDFVDVTGRVEDGRRLRALARQDDLTGLPNRRALLEALDARLGADTSADGDGGTKAPVALAVLDIDRFKEINDSLGHLTGDELLRTVGQRLLEAASPEETVARLGGDDFAVLLPGLDTAAAADRVRALAASVEGPMHVGDLRLGVRASLGFAVHPVDAGDTAELMRRADIAMYQAKELGSGPHHYDAANDWFSRERVTLAADLHTAVEQDQLVLHHQPLVSVKTGQIVGFESLVRWLHPELGLLPPGRFIELAEISGHIAQITRWVVRRALRDLGELRALGASLEVSVNLSVRNLYEADFLPWLADALAETGTPGDRLVVEITESTVMVDPTAAIRAIEGMRGLGVRTWIDDFGTGHSSLARLRALPVDGVKIDRAFVTGVAWSPTDRDVLSSLVDLVGSLGLQTIVEGVEQAECLELLKELDCDLAQGYHIARPLPLDELVTLLGLTPAVARLPHPASAGDDLAVPERSGNSM